MTTDIFSEFQSEDITDEMLDEAAQLFSENYGIWGKHPPGLGGKPEPGTRVRLNGPRLRDQCLPAGARCFYARVTVDGTLAGHAFACRWDYQGRQVCWVTQLVIHRDYRQRRLATRLLEKLRRTDDEIFGIMSSHPAACISLSKACADFAFPHVPLEFVREHAAALKAASPVTYVKDAELRGSLFSETSDLVSGVDSNFFVDHEEPFAALAWVQEKSLWPLGNLPDGHEFLLVFESSRRQRSRFLSERRQGQVSGNS